MIEKQLSKWIIITLFVVVICLSNVIWFFIPNSKSISNENRQLNEKPVFSVDTYAEYSNEYTLWYNDHVAFRGNLVALNSLIDYYLFSSSANAQVLKGEDNWLFYDNETDGNPIGNIQSSILYTDDELEMIKKNCIKQDESIKADGKEFVILIIPNKERVYSDYLPAYIGNPVEIYRTLQVYQYLKDNTDINVVYCYDGLMKARESITENIWYKTDTHWNDIGAYVCSRELMKAIGVDMPSIDDENITIRDMGHISGDLAGMLNLSKTLAKYDNVYSVEGYNLHDRDYHVGDESGFVWNAVDADPRSVLLVGDSFSNTLVPLLASQFDEGRQYIYRSGYNEDYYYTYNPDIVVYETVERYIDSLSYFKIK